MCSCQRETCRQAVQRNVPFPFTGTLVSWTPTVAIPSTVADSTSCAVLLSLASLRGRYGSRWLDNRAKTAEQTQAHVQNLRVLTPLVCFAWWAEIWTKVPTSLKHLGHNVGWGNPFFSWMWFPETSELLVGTLASGEVLLPLCHAAVGCWWHRVLSEPWGMLHTLCNLLLFLCLFPRHISLTLPATFRGRNSTRADYEYQHSNLYAISGTWGPANGQLPPLSPHHIP